MLRQFRKSNKAVFTKGTRGDFRNPKLIARMGDQGIFRHQLLGNLPRKGLIDTTLGVDFSELIKFKLDILTQLLAFVHEIRLFCVGLRANGHILASGHRHGARYQSRDTRDQDIVLRRGRCGNADDQACRRDNPIVGAEDRCSQPPNAVDKVVLRVQVRRRLMFTSAVLWAGRPSTTRCKGVTRRRIIFFSRATNSSAVRPRS